MQPIFVDLDTKNDIFCDGFIGAVQIEGQYPRDFFSYRNKLIYFHGKEKPLKKSYLLQVQTIAKNTMAKLDKELKKYQTGEMDCEYPSFCTGLFVNIPSQVTIPFWK